MKFLLDTCTFLWLILGDLKIHPSVKKIIENPENDFFLSVVSVWEILVKRQFGKFDLPENGGHYIQTQREKHGIYPLVLDEKSISHLSKLPPIHRDPFDRMLICQAMEHGLSIVTPDPAICAYPIKIFWQ